MTDAWSRLRELRERAALLFLMTATEPIEALLGFVALIWGLWLGWFDVFGKSPAVYSAMSGLMPRAAWAAMLTGIGLVKLTAVLIASSRTRVIVTWAAVCVWSFLSFGFWIGGMVSPGGPLCALFALASAWVVFRRRAVSGQQDHRGTPRRLLRRSADVGGEPPLGWLERPKAGAPLSH